METRLAEELTTAKTEFRHLEQRTARYAPGTVPEEVETLEVDLLGLSQQKDVYEARLGDYELELSVLARKLESARKALSEAGSEPPDDPPDVLIDLDDRDLEQEARYIEIRDEIRRLEALEADLKAKQTRDTAALKQTEVAVQDRQTRLGRLLLVVWEGALITYQPTKYMFKTKPVGKVSIGIDNLEKYGVGVAAVQQACNEAALKIMQAARERWNKAAQDLDEDTDYDELTGIEISVQMLKKAIEEEIPKLEQEAAQKAVALIQTRNTFKDMNTDFKLNAAGKLVWSGLKLGFSVVRLVFTAGLDISGYITGILSLAEAAGTIKALWDEVEDAWSDVKDHLAATTEVLESATPTLYARTLISELLPSFVPKIGKGSPKKLEDASKTHKAKLGGVLKKQEELCPKIEEAIKHLPTEGITDEDREALADALTKLLEDAEGYGERITEQTDNATQMDGFISALQSQTAEQVLSRTQTFRDLRKAQDIISTAKNVIEVCGMII